MSIALLVVTDGRLDYLRQTVASAEERLHGDITERWMYDDTGDYGHRVALVEEFPQFRHFNAGSRQGFGGAIRAAWDFLANHSTAEFVFHLEQDFTFNRDVHLDYLADTLNAHPHVVQLAFRRQPWNDEERAAGGLVEQHPEDFVDRSCPSGCHHWLEHRRYFTTNPSLYRRSLCSLGWPKGDQSEGRFGIRLLEAHPDWRFAFWGSRDSGEWVEHVGHQRVGTGY